MTHGPQDSVIVAIVEYQFVHVCLWIGVTHTEAMAKVILVLQTSHQDRMLNMRCIVTR